MRNVLDWLECAACFSPSAVAFDSPVEKLTWGEVMTRAKQIGSWIAERLPTQSPVLILMEKRPVCIAVMLGAVYAGCFYTPLDTGMPLARMKVIAKVLQPKLILCEG